MLGAAFRVLATCGTRAGKTTVEAVLTTIAFRTLAYQSAAPSDPKHQSVAPGSDEFDHQLFAVCRYDNESVAPLIEQHRDRIIELCKQYGIMRLDVFGSAARGYDFDLTTSDVDFFYDIDVDALNLAGRYFDFLVELEALLGRSVDLADMNPRHPNPYFLESANRSRVSLYDSLREKASA